MKYCKKCKDSETEFRLTEWGLASHHLAEVLKSLQKSPLGERKKCEDNLHLESWTCTPALRKGERFLESPWISLSSRIGTVITAPWGERGAPAMGDHRHLPKLTRLLGTSPARQISSVLRQAQPALRPSPASLPWLWRKGLWLLLFRSEWKKKKKQDADENS